VPKSYLESKLSSDFDSLIEPEFKPEIKFGPKPLTETKLESEVALDLVLLSPNSSLK